MKNFILKTATALLLVCLLSAVGCGKQDENYGSIPAKQFEIIFMDGDDVVYKTSVYDGKDLPSSEYPIKTKCYHDLVWDTSIKQLKSVKENKIVKLLSKTGNTYTIFYDFGRFADDDTLKADRTKETVVYGELIPELLNPTTQDYTLDKWTYGDRVFDDDIYLIDGDITLVAVWKSSWLGPY